MSVRIFIHGLDSSNQGTKSIFFREKFPDMIIPNFRADLQERMKRLQGILSDKTDIQLVGSSLGGLMASLFTLENPSRVQKVILLAPALQLPEFSPQAKKETAVPAWIYHGRHDEVVPLPEIEPVAKRVFRNLSFHVLEDDHSLHKTFKNIDWNSLLQ